MEFSEAVSGTGVVSDSFPDLVVRNNNGGVSINGRIQIKNAKYQCDDAAKQ